MTELEKMEKVKEKSQTIGEFLDWLQNEKEISLCEYLDDEYSPISDNIEQILAKYFNIDLNQIEKEKMHYQSVHRR